MIASLQAMPILYWLPWCALVLLVAALVVVKRLRWGKNSPLQRYALYSLLAHAALACIATLVRLVSGGAGDGIERSVVQVRIIASAPAAEMAEEPSEEPVEYPEIAPKALPKPEQVEQTEPEVEPAVEPVPMIEKLVVEEPTVEEKPPILAEPMLEAESNTVVEDFQELMAESPAEVEPVMPMPELPPIEPEIAAVEAKASTEPLAQRDRPDRLEYVKQQGGSQETEAGVVNALGWLASAQSLDGRWDASQHSSGRERRVLGDDRQGAGFQADTGITGLALLAFQAAGHTHERGDYQQTVRAGIEFLKRQQTADGNLAGGARRYARTYCHSMATFALADALAMTDDAQLKQTVQRAVNYTLRSQHPSTGGWRYRPGDTGDTSQLGWQMMALRSAELAGIEFPATTWTGVDRFLRSVRRGRNGELASYVPHGSVSRTMTAEAIYCRHMLIKPLGGEIDSRVIEGALESLLVEPPSASRVNLYYWYYGTLAMHRTQNASAKSGELWRKWNEALKPALLSKQETYGPNAGSWSPDTVWGGYGGRVYSTALATLCLEVYYRFSLPEKEIKNPWIAADSPRDKVLR